MQESFAAKNPTYQLKVINMANCDLNFTTNNGTFVVPKFADHKAFEVGQSFINVNNYRQNFKVSGTCVNSLPNFPINTNTTQTLFLYAQGSNLNTVINPINVTKPEIGKSQIKFFGLNIESFGNVSGYITEKKVEKIFGISYIDSIYQNKNESLEYVKIDYDKYTFEIKEATNKIMPLVKGEILLETCGRYSIFLFPNSTDPKKLDYAFTTDIVPSGLSIYYQLIQIVVMSFGEGFNNL